MKTITLYLIRQTVAVMGMTVMVFAFALLMGNMMKEILALLVTGHVSFLLISKAFLLLIPFVLVYALPMGMLTRHFAFIWKVECRPGTHCPQSQWSQCDAALIASHHDQPFNERLLCLDQHRHRTQVSSSLQESDP